MSDTHFTQLRRAWPGDWKPYQPSNLLRSKYILRLTNFSVIVTRHREIWAANVTIDRQGSRFTDRRSLIVSGRGDSISDAVSRLKSQLRAVHELTNPANWELPR